MIAHIGMFEVKVRFGPGSVAQTPRQSRLPCSSTTQIDVVFCDTSSPTECGIQTSDGANHRAKCPDRGTIDCSASNRDYPRSIHGAGPPKQPDLSNAGRDGAEAPLTLQQGI